MTHTKTSKAVRIIGPYEIIKKLDAGGMGVVFKARRRGSSDDVALKALPPKLATCPERVTRFRREVLACSRLDHPNLVRILEHGCDRGVHYFTMHYFPGLSLKKTMKRDGAFSSTRTLHLARQIVSACEYYHDKGLVHRDIKPANILVNQRDEVKIIDFGLAKIRDLSTVTRVDQAIGTARYMPPEVLAGRLVDAASDLYQVGLIVHEMLTGEPVFKGSEPMAAVRAYVLGGAPLERFNYRISDPFWNPIIRRCLDVDRKARYQHASQLYRDLSPPESGFRPPVAPIPSRQHDRQPPRKRERTNRLHQRRPPPAYPLRLILPAVLVVCLIAAGTILLLSPPIVASHVSFRVGVDVAEVRWSTNRSVPSELEFSRLDDSSFQRVRQTTETRDHRILLEDLLPGRRYRAHIILPGDRRSPQHVFATTTPTFSIASFEIDDSDTAHVLLTTDPPLVCELRYESINGPVRLSSGVLPRRTHRWELSAFDRSSSANVRLTIFYRTTSDGTRHEEQVALPEH